MGTCPFDGFTRLGFDFFLRDTRHLLLGLRGRAQSPERVRQASQVSDEILVRWKASLEERILANRALLHGKVKVSKGGSRLRASTLERLSRKERAVVALVERVRADWTARVEGVDVHAFRKTHQTWAEAEGVPAVLIDKQLGHAVAGGSSLDVFRAVRALSGSRVGRKHYLDLGSQLLDPTPSAEAVRRLLDDALAARAATVPGAPLRAEPVVPTA